MLHELIGPAVVCVPLVQNVLADLVKGLGDVKIEGK